MRIRKVATTTMAALAVVGASSAVTYADTPIAPIGSTIHVGYAVDDAVTATGPTMINPERGYFQVTNTLRSGAGGIDVFTFDIQTNTGQIVRQVPSTGTDPTQYNDAGYLRAGETHSGNVIFAVPSGQRITQLIAVDTGIGRSPVARWTVP